MVTSSSTNINKAIGILICDCNSIFRKGLRATLHEHHCFNKIIEVVNYDDLIKQLPDDEINVILLNEKSIKTEFCIKNLNAVTNARVIVTSDFCEIELALKYMNHGAYGFIPKLADEDDYLKTIKDVACGIKTDNIELTRQLKALLCKVSLENLKRDYNLSRKETEMMLMITEGKSNKIIAHELNITERTVEFHKTNIYKKTGCNSVVDLVLITIGSRLL